MTWQSEVESLDHSFALQLHSYSGPVYSLELWLIGKPPPQLLQSLLSEKSIIALAYQCNGVQLSISLQLAKDWCDKMQPKLESILVRWNSLSYLIFLTNVSYAYHTITSNFMQLVLILQNCLIFSLYVFMMCVHPIEHKRGEFLRMQYLYYYVENQSFNPLTPKISLVILLTVCHTVLVMLVCRIWY